MLLALIHVLILKKQRAFSSKERHASPEEEQGKGIEGPQTYKAIEIDNELITRKLSVVELHPH